MKCFTGGLGIADSSPFEVLLPETQNTKHETRNKEHETRNPKPETRKIKHETRNAKSETTTLETTSSYSCNVSPPHAVDWRLIIREGRDVRVELCGPQI